MIRNTLFTDRNIGPSESEIKEMLKEIKADSLTDLMHETAPESILINKELSVNKAITENNYHEYLWKIAQKNKVFKTYIGQGYYNTFMPAPIQRNILENPAWYTPYTPYQAEISQGRLEALLNFQTMVASLTGMELANASLLDESTAMAEAVIMMLNSRTRNQVKQNVNKLFIDRNIFLQTLEVIKTRSEPLDIEIEVGDYKSFEPNESYFGIVVQYPAADGEIYDYRQLTDKAHKSNVLVAVAADILSLCLLTPPGEWGADIVAGSTQRFGIPMGYGGPHAAFFATKEQFKRYIPGRIIGISKDRYGKRALRMALQTREQHIKREKATSNICTAQALLASMASMYAVYHGPQGLWNIAGRIHSLAVCLEKNLGKLGFNNLNENYFDTLRIQIPEMISVDDIKNITEGNEINLFYFSKDTVGISLDETTNLDDIKTITEVFAKMISNVIPDFEKHCEDDISFDPAFLRKSKFMEEEVFSRYHSETELMRYIKRLETRDYSLTHGMIPLGSCTMKLNSASSMFGLSWPEFHSVHPFAPENQALGYRQLIHELKNDLLEITGFDDISFMPNSGASGEYTGLMTIRAFHKNNGNADRNVALIPSSAHGTNPASAVMAGYKVVVVKCDENGNISLKDLKEKIEKNNPYIGAMMITYPSTHGVYEDQITEVIKLVHEAGGQVYMDGANMNAQVGITKPALIGADVCHLNLHKTFAIPHGGGGPGMGPIGVKAHLAPYLPTHPYHFKGEKSVSAVSAAPYGSASILTISHAYIKMLGQEGLRKSTEIAILNANYLAKKLKPYYPVLYVGKKGRVAHEFILDCRHFKKECGIDSTDIAKRLIDYGFHAPTLSFPVPDTLMVEPTESESKVELDRFVDAMIAIKNELEEVKNGTADKNDNVLKNAPHTIEEASSDNWNHSYSREKAVYPVPELRIFKFWPPVGRVDNAFGDRNLVCTCEPVSSYAE